MSRYNITKNKKTIKVTASYLRKLIKESTEEEDLQYQYDEEEEKKPLTPKQVEQLANDLKLIKGKFVKITDLINESILLPASGYKEDVARDKIYGQIMKLCESITFKEYNLIYKLYNAGFNLRSHGINFDLITDLIILYGNGQTRYKISHHGLISDLNLNMNTLRAHERLENIIGVYGLPSSPHFETNHSSPSRPRYTPPNTDHLDPFTGYEKDGYIKESRKIKISSSQLRNLIRETINETKQTKRNQIRIR